MNYSNYNNLPSISCEDRMYNPNKPTKKLNESEMKDICNGLNPNKIYNTFFGKNHKTNYKKIPNKEAKDIINNYTDKSIESCSRSCSNNKNCKSFNYEDNTQCYLYKHAYLAPSSQKNINFTKVYKDNKWRYKDREETLDELIQINYVRLDDYFEK